MRKYLRHSYKRWLLGSCFVFTVVVSAKYEQYRLEIADMQDIPVMAAYNKGVERIDENILPGKIGIQEINQNIKPVNVSKKKESERAIKSYTKTEKYCVPCEYVYDEEMLEGNVETVQDAKEGIKEVTVLASYLNNEEIEKINESDRLRSDLSMDSINAMYVSMKMELKLELENDDEIAHYIAQNPDLTVGELLNFVCNKISNVKV